MKYRAWSKTIHLLMSARLLFGLPMLAAEAKEKKEKKNKKEEEVRIPFSPSGGWEAFFKGLGLQPPLSGASQLIRLPQENALAAVRQSVAGRCNGFQIGWM